MKYTFRLLLLLLISSMCMADASSGAFTRSDGLPVSFLSGEFRQAFFNNRPLSLDVQNFSTYYVTRSDAHTAEVRIGSKSARPLAATIRVDGSLFPRKTTACGLLDSYNFVSVVEHRAPEHIDQSTKWSAVIPVQFVDCSNATIPVVVSVENLDGNRLHILAEGKIGGPTRYEGNPSSSHSKLEVRMQFVNGKLLECDGTALEDLDSVKGHSAWMLAAIPAPN